MLVHTYFKKKDAYKVKMFLNMKAVFKDPVKCMETIMSEYEVENNCSLGDNRDLKLLRLPNSYLEEKGIRVYEEELKDEEFIDELKKSQDIVEI